MLPRHLLRFDVRGDAVEPMYLDQRHAPLVRIVSWHYSVHEGFAASEVERKLREVPQLRSHDSRLIRGIEQVVREHFVASVEAAVPPRRLREVLFATAQRQRDESREAVIASAAAALGVPALGLEECLYADIGEERRLRCSRPLPGVTEMISRYNFRLLQGLMARAECVVIRLDETVRPVYRLAKLNGLLVEVRQRSAAGVDAGGRLELAVTGPLSLLQRTQRYGRALARFLPACCLAGRYELEARLNYGDRSLRLMLTEADRVLSPHAPPQPFDSHTEERFYRDFVRLGSRWDILREATILRIGRGVAIPDFTFQLRSDPSIRAHLEIVGFWTRDYLARKFRLMQEVGGAGVIFCVDERHCGDRSGTPAGSSCIGFRRNVPAVEVLRILDARSPDCLPWRRSPDSALLPIDRRRPPLDPADGAGRPPRGEP